MKWNGSSNNLIFGFTNKRAAVSEVRRMATEHPLALESYWFINNGLNGGCWDCKNPVKVQMENDL